ncbi:IclR family transcriptional regulator [Kocuria dechangensis]|uniref:Glycerol operon regulatory protein n=1 Tax=Kocuria dechangensis TaxID=1176249 RepID=A0A917H9J2_9MICC|nr:IclR family transcriptional regulator [Kocuria dechangensis]GGG72330.1 IclR family transcriptional regulator [Kocuria dechangensis]
MVTQARPPSPSLPVPEDEAATEGVTPGGVQSVDRAITVLELLGHLGSASVVRVAQELGVHKSTASRLLSALEARGMVVQNHERGKYQLGFGILRLAHAIPARLSLVTEAHDEMRRLAEEHRETVNLAVLREGVAVNVAQEIGPTSLGTHNWIGSLTPLHATSSGKVLLAALPSAERADLIKKVGLKSFTGRTITSRRQLERQLLDVAAQGYATALEELEIGINAIAVPVRDHLGTVVAAISVSGPAFRLTEETMQAMRDDLRAAGLTISRRIGFDPQG